jgi:small-conductance mechanosensitive channel
MRRIGLLCFLVLHLGACRAGEPEPPENPPANQTASAPEQVSFYLPQDTPATADSLPAALDLRLNSIEQRLGEVAASLEELEESASSNTAGQVAGTDTSAAVIAENEAQETVQDAQRFGWRVLWTIVTLIVFFLIVKAVSWLLRRVSKRSARPIFFRRLIPIVQAVLWIAAIYHILADIFEVDQIGVAAILAALGIIAAFTAQDVLRNIFGGISIILDQPFQVGNKIRVGGTSGEVIKIGLRSTTILTPDENVVLVPNAQVTQGQVINSTSGMPYAQVLIDLYLPGWVDVMKAKSIAYSAAASSRYVYLDKPVVVLVKDEFRGTFLTHLQIEAYVMDVRYRSLFVSDVTETAKTEFLRHNMLSPVNGLNIVDEPGTSVHSGNGGNKPVDDQI